jgi:hypothetical protein
VLNEGIRTPQTLVVTPESDYALSIFQSKDDPEMGFGFQYKMIVKLSGMGDGAAGFLSGSFEAPDADQREALGG